MKPSKIYPFTIPAGGALPVLVEGDVFKIISASGVLSVTGDSFGTLGPLLPGQGLRDTPYRRLVLNDLSGFANNVSILVADSNFIDDRVTGEVSVLDGGKSRTMAASAFLISTAIGSVAGQLASLQLWNPGTSGKNAVVEAVFFSSSSAGVIDVGFGTQMNTAGVFARSKKSGGTAASSQYNATNTVGNPPGYTGTFLGVALAANTPFMYVFKEPVVVLPGYGLTIVCEALATDLRGGFEFFEEIPV